MSAQTWAGVRERVLELAGLPGAERVFGFPRGGSPLEDPLTEAEVADLERYCGVRLPEEYRDFLLHVGAGGAGPAYGVFPVRRGEDGTWGWEGDGGDMTLPRRLAEPFRERMSPAERAALLGGWPEEEAYEDVEAYDAACDAWEERLLATLWSDEYTVGAICLCHLGCAQRQWLVVSGPERGRMWDDTRCDHDDLEPLGVTFARWYLDWLDEAYAKATAG
ncbi:SMI1/KNR4 family protein [Streptomyces sudanensis]|uniref:SMI1/KNR4 family protein n=1 Tax=Streptomyces sudanensis TaxID=436397 RepID=UPI0020CDB231|nr:SMI1/KNR4 family protein [Streptomyces sudanensis]MCP9958270.1 SMI1/KNR4 family protein [Streptomyces sudanensis]MCP9987397.1 SMI1/KNR4 family protein [Streptomyces sudanensis]MCQ0001209.1 SMI1/KNR4 family protein [Streptomyces sudanensis]